MATGDFDYAFLWYGFKATEIDYDQWRAWQAALCPKFGICFEATSRLARALEFERLTADSWEFQGQGSGGADRISIFRRPKHQ